MTEQLFDVDPKDPDAPVCATFVRRPKEEADPSEPSPFGTTLPEGYVRTEGTRGEGEALVTVRLLTTGLASPDSERAPIQKAKRYDPRNHYPRTYKALAKLFPGGKFWRADYVQPTAAGIIIAKDTMGFADIMGAVPPHASSVAAQVTTFGSIAQHLRKYTDPTKTHGQDKTPIETHLREFLAVGGRLLIFGFALPEGARLWEHEVVEVTPALLDSYKARKRKRAA